MWTNWNDTLHSNNLVSQTIKASTIDSQIRQMYELQSTFAQPDQRLFQLPLEQSLNSNTRSKRYWIVLATRYCSTTNQRVAGSQYKMTHFFPNLCPPDRPPPQPPYTQQPIAYNKIIQFSAMEDKLNSAIRLTSCSLFSPSPSPWMLSQDAARDYLDLLDLGSKVA